MRTSIFCRALLVVAGSTFGVALADTYDPPASYYNAATGTGATLKAQLHTIITNGFTPRSYDDLKLGLPIVDADPSNPANIILIYTGATVPGPWVTGGVTWNREHTWPQSRGVGSNGQDYSDMFEVRPSDPNENGARGNKPYGIGGSYWDPDALSGSSPYRFRGDCARTMFYMDTRYDGTQTNTVDLALVNGFPGTNQMGDLAALLEWHYSQPVSARERRRNHYVYSSVDNPAHFQGNRNPFIDHPEYVWAIWGTQPNNSTIYVGAGAAGDGSSSLALNLGTIIVGGPAFAPQNVTINKSGSTPTTFDITASGAATSPAAYPRQAFTYNAGSQVISVGVTGAGSPGLYSGSLTIDNTDLTSGGAGQGAADANDTVTVSATVLAHSNGSFSPGSDVNSITIDLGRFRSGNAVSHSQALAVYNLVSTPGFTASLDVDGVSGTGDTAVLTTDLAAPQAIAAGSGVAVSASIDASAPVGEYEAVYTIATSDQNLGGATSGTSLVLTVRGQLMCPADINLDGFVSGDDFDAYIIAFEAGDPYADFNEDGFTSGDDFDGFVVAFEGGC